MNKITTYTYGNSPHLLPLGEQTEHEDWQLIYLAAGFNPADEETTLCELGDDWKEHKKGALVVSGLMTEGHPFAVVENWEGIESGWYELPYGGSVKIESGKPVRVSDGATDEDEGGAEEDEIRAGLDAYGFEKYRIPFDSWAVAADEPDMTAPLELEEGED